MSQRFTESSLNSWACGYWLLLTSITALAGVGGYWFTIRPLQNAREENQNKIEMSRKYANCEQLLRVRNQTVIEKHTAVAQTLRLQLNRLPEATHEAEFLSWTSKQAHELGLELRDFRPAGGATYGTFEGLKIRLNGVGSYATICKYLQALSEGPRMTRVVSIELLPDNAERGQFQLTLQIVVFYQPRKSLNQNPGEKSHV